MKGILRPLFLSLCCLLLAPGLLATAADKTEPPRRALSSTAPATDAEFVRVTQVCVVFRRETAYCK